MLPASPVLAQLNHARSDETCCGGGQSVFVSIAWRNCDNGTPPRQYGPRLSIAERSSPGLRIADETVTRFQWPDPSPPISVLEKKREQNRDTSDKRPQQSRQHCSFYSSERREGGLSCVARFSFIAVGKVHIKDSEYASRGGGHTHLPH